MYYKLILPLLLLLTAVTPGCGNNTIERLDGAWNCDGLATLELYEEKLALSETERERANQFLEAMGVTIDSAKRTIAFTMGVINEIKPYTVVTDSGKNIELKAGVENPFSLISDSVNRSDMPVTDRITIIVRDKDTILFSDAPQDNRNTIVLRRADNGSSSLHAFERQNAR